MIATFRSYIEGPRWCDFAGAIRKGAVVCGVDVVDIAESTSLLTRVVGFKVRGEEADVRRFKQGIERTVARYNED